MAQKGFDSFRAFCKGKRIAVLGAGISNRPLIKVLAGAGADVHVFDRRSREALREFIEELEEQHITCSYSLSETYLESLKGFEVIFKTPVIRPDIPELAAERKRGAVITSEMEVFMTHCPAEITAITGSDGKTTTSTLVSLLLRSAGYKTWLGGNIGTPLLQYLPEIQSEDQVVLELSSFQLMTMCHSPERAIITNISPNHLDVHKDYQEYMDAKANIFRHQCYLDRLVLTGSDPILQRFAEEARGKVVWSEMRPFGEQECFGLDGHVLYYQASPTAPKERLLERRDLLLPGRYNALNVLSALAAVDPLLPDRRSALEAVCSFTGVEHRTQLLRELHGVRYYNSSIDSSPNRSLNTLSAFKENNVPVLMIAGGKDKNCDYTGLGKAIAESCRQLYLCGANAPLIRDIMEKEAPSDFPITDCRDYAEALSLAKACAKPGDAVVLSPAGTSFDRYENFMQRGRDFAKLVEALEETL